MRTLGQSGAVGMCAGVCQTSRLFRGVKPPKAGIACLMSVAAAALCAPQAVQAELVIATINATVTQGKDATGMFGFAPGANLANQKLTLTYVIDSTKGTQGLIYNGLGVVIGSCIEDSFINGNS